MLFLLMLHSPQTVLAGASTGLVLWYQSALPSLFPFFVLTSLLLQTGTVFTLNQLAGPFLCKLFGISGPAVFPVVCGYLCGFPMGARTSSDLTRQQQISSEEGEYLLSFCNNASPAFLIGYVCNHALQMPQLAVPALLILTGSSLLSSFLFRRFFYRENASLPSRLSPAPSPSSGFAEALDESILAASDSIVKIGGYMIVFSILLEFLKLLFTQNHVWTTFLLAFVELTNGIRMISDLPVPDPLRFVFAMSVTSFGGLCAIFQTKSMIRSQSWSIFRYITEKLITTMATSLFALLYVMIFFS